MAARLRLERIEIGSGASVNVERAISLWPSRNVHFLLGDIDTDEPVNPLMEYLQAALNFKSVTPGAAPRR